MDEIYSNDAQSWVGSEIKGKLRLKRLSRLLVRETDPTEIHFLVLDCCELHAVS